MDQAKKKNAFSSLCREINYLICWQHYDIVTSSISFECNFRMKLQCSNDGVEQKKIKIFSIFHTVYRCQCIFESNKLVHHIQKCHMHLKSKQNNCKIPSCTLYVMECVDHFKEIIKKSKKRIILSSMCYALYGRLKHEIKCAYIQTWTWMLELIFE